ncbi:MAG: cytidylate kinase family protein [Thaumarchaeota archaeon]|nr:cytidylate kinase family protein [Nitrososphaerota archaeon]
MQKSVIISGPPAIGKTTIAKGLASELDLKYLSGGDVLKELAKEEGFQTEGVDWWDTKQGMKFLNQRKTNPEFDKKVDIKLKELFYKGGLIITSYTLPWLVQDGIKIWLAGSCENSAKRMTTRDKLSYNDALEIVKKRFEENKKIYKMLYGFDFGEDLSVFDKVINTDGLGIDQVLSQVKSAIKDLL